MQVRTFPTVEAFFETLFGPAQHDAHVQTRHRELFLRKWEGWHANARAADAEREAQSKLFWEAAE